MSELKKQAVTLYQLIDSNQFAWEHISRNDMRWSKKWVPLEVAINAVFEKNKERFAEIKSLENKIAAYQKWLNDKTVPHVFINSKTKFTEIFGEQTPVSTQKVNEK